MASSQSTSNPSNNANEPLVLLKENRMAHTALSRLADTAEGDFSLVFLFGQSGTGKSHFVRHLVRRVRRQNARTRVESLTAAEFLAKLGQAFTQETEAEFQARFAEVDLFVLEDIGALQGRIPAQRMLIAILDDLKRAGGRVVVTSSCLPGRLRKIVPRLANRFRGGATVALELLDENGRREMARHLAASRVLLLSDDAAAILAKAGPSTPREILAALINLEASRRRNGASDASLVGAHLRAGQHPRDRSLARVAKLVGRFYGVPLSDLRSGSRQKQAVLARQIAMLLARDLSGCSAASIAKFFRRKNHATVVHACRRTRALLAADPMLAREVDGLKRSAARL